MATNRIGGIIFFKIDGAQFRAKGSWTYNLGVPKKTMQAGSDNIHGYTEQPQVPFIEGTITDRSELDLQALQEAVDVSCTLELANDKVISLKNAVWASEGNVTTEMGEIECRMEGLSAQEIR